MEEVEKGREKMELDLGLRLVVVRKSLALKEAMPKASDLELNLGWS
jgi:hypothetical protein